MTLFTKDKPGFARAGRVVQKMRIEFSPPDISEQEIAEVIQCLRSGWITTGERTGRLEKEIARQCGASRAACVSSATAALELTLRLLGIGPGDEVVTSAYTYSASAAVIHHVGAKIVLVDTAKDSYEMDIGRLADAITEKTKAIIPVDIGGVMCDYQRIFHVVNEKSNLFQPSGNKLQRLFRRPVVLADAAHSFGARYEGLSSGNAADFSCFSFHAVKNLTTAEGGAILWRERPGLDDGQIYKELMLLALHGQTKDALSKLMLGAWEYDIVIPGYKYNMTDILASLGLAQLHRFGALMARRKELIGIYDRILSPVRELQCLDHFQPRRPGNGHLYLTRVHGMDEARRDEMIRRLAEQGIATNVHFKPLPLFTAYRNMGFDIAEYPNAYAQYANEITLPMHTLLTDQQAIYVAETFRRILLYGMAEAPVMMRIG